MTGHTSQAAMSLRHSVNGGVSQYQHHQLMAPHRGCRWHYLDRRYSNTPLQLYARKPSTDEQRQQTSVSGPWDMMSRLSTRRGASHLRSPLLPNTRASSVHDTAFAGRRSSSTANSRTFRKCRISSTIPCVPRELKCNQNMGAGIANADVSPIQSRDWRTEQCTQFG